MGMFIYTKIEEMKAHRRKLEIRKWAAIGVEVPGIDVTTLDETTWRKIYQAWLDDNVTVVRDQELTISKFIEYSERFGLVGTHPSKSTRHPDIPEITMLGINKFNADGSLNKAIYRRGAEGWHTDGAYDRHPVQSHPAVRPRHSRPGR